MPTFPLDAADDIANVNKASDQETETQSNADLLTKQMRHAKNVLMRFDPMSTRKNTELSCVTDNLEKRTQGKVSLCFRKKLIFWAKCTNRINKAHVSTVPVWNYSSFIYRT